MQRVPHLWLTRLRSSLDKRLHVRMSHDDKYENVPIILAYKWTPSPAIIVRSLPLRRDFLHGVPKLMNLIYHICELFLGVNVTIAKPESDDRFLDIDLDIDKSVELLLSDC